MYTFSPDNKNVSGTRLEHVRTRYTDCLTGDSWKNKAINNWSGVASPLISWGKKGLVVNTCRLFII
jgi:hypothetical protein